MAMASCIAGMSLVYAPALPAFLCVLISGMGPPCIGFQAVIGSFALPTVYWACAMTSVCTALLQLAILSVAQLCTSAHGLQSPRKAAVAGAINITVRHHMVLPANQQSALCNAVLSSCMGTDIEYLRQLEVSDTNEGDYWCRLTGGSLRLLLPRMLQWLGQPHIADCQKRQNWRTR